MEKEETLIYLAKNGFIYDENGKSFTVGINRFCKFFDIKRTSILEDNVMKNSINNETYKISFVDFKNLKEENFSNKSERITKYEDFIKNSIVNDEVENEIFPIAKSLTILKIG